MSASFTKLWKLYANKLDPLSLGIVSALGDAHFNLGDFEKAEETYLRVIDMNPKYRTAVYGLGWTYFKAGKIEKAVEAFETAHRYTGQDTHGVTPLGFIYGKVGRINDALECIKRLKKREEQENDVSLEVDFAVVYFGLEDYDKVFEYLDRAYDKRLGGLLFLKTSHWNELKKDPRYDKFIEKIGF